jgi:hypothetical protein
VKDFSKILKNPEEIKNVKSESKVIGNYTWYLGLEYDAEIPSQILVCLNCESEQAK